MGPFRDPAAKPVDTARLPPAPDSMSQETRMDQPASTAVRPLM
jgi:hypothetical protein